MIEVTALGELLIDFTENGMSNQNNPLFEANPGGAPCNVLAMLSKLGNKTAVIAKVGNDYFGHMLKEKVQRIGIDTSCLYFDEKIHTTLAFVHTAEDGDRDFSFFRNPGADMMLKETEIKEELIKESKIFHFGSLSLTHEVVRKATKRAVEIAKTNKVLLSFDPNLREPLWDNLTKAKEQITYGINQCDILKIADNELEWYTGEFDYDQAVKKLQKDHQISLVLVTRGKKGSRAYYKDKIVEVDGISQNHTIDTTGAGDTFGACILDYILKNGIENLSEEQLKEMLLFANAAASLITTKKGALCVMPSKEEINLLIQERKVQ